ncbi:MAG: hypothetical protein OMM_03570 [Candidatus Magnetoglobus multicellularis str. Araruama]|uniref:Uncharacterized protein n=1 Tax=Candidatus Magnetoglobus multicellularis str. Araruama TaxID=890399 RepID=A0A1V1P5A1_9BACT|nr:MAG: hypothetical protein OMM_03570 [Candidatus Magnetoglobus multicellularis str. Araruama]
MGKDRILSAIINKIVNIEKYNESYGSEFGLSGKSEIGLNLKLNNAIGIPGDALEIDLSSFSGEYVYELADEKDVSGDVKTTQTVSGSFNVNALDAKLAQKFSGNARQNNGPKFLIDPKTGLSFNIDGEKRISLNVTSEGDKTLEFKQLTFRNTDFGLFTSVVEEEYLSFQTNSSIVINELSDHSQLVENMLNGHHFSVFPNAYNQARDAIISIRSDDIQWETLTREINKISIPFDIEIGQGVLLGLHLQIDTISVLEFTAKHGILSPQKGFLTTAIYEKDDWISNHIKGPRAVLDVYLQVLRNIIADVFDTIEQTVELGKEMIIQTGQAISEGGAQLKAKQGRLLIK